MTNININTDTLRQALNGDEEAIKEAQSLLPAPRALAEAGLPAPDLPDEWVDAKKLREVIDKLRDDGHYVSENLADELEAILPTPPAPRTLADMAPEERAECDWMQCDHPALEEPGVILQIWGNGCHVLSREGVVETEALNHVTPRPDLPRMEWPGNEPEDDVAAATGGELTTQDVVDECRAVRKERSSFYAAAPRPEDVPVGEAWQVEVNGKAAIGYRNDPEDMICWTVVYRDEANHDWMYDSDVTLISRLVPETTEQDDATETTEHDDEPVFDPAYTYRDREGDKWLHVEGAWRWANSSSGPIKGDYRTPPTKYGPYTRIEKENQHDQ